MAIRHAIRSLVRSPWYAVTAIGTITLTIALSATVFAVIDGVLFRPLPYPDADRVFRVTGVDATGGSASLAPADVRYLLQHASYDAQKALFPLVEAGYRDGTVPGQSYALLLDSILVWEGKPQVYGSKARPVDEWVDGEPTFWPIDDEADVDRRRAEVGLSPLAEYREMLKRLNFPDE